MAKRRFAIRLSRSEDTTLREQYVLFRIPTDQYKKRPREMKLFTDTWNYATGRSDEPMELLHYMVTQRKQKYLNWPTLGTNYKKLASSESLLTLDEEQHLRRIYTELVLPLNIGTDEFFYNSDLVAEVAKALAKAIGRRIPGPVLMGFIEAKQSAGSGQPFAVTAAMASVTLAKSASPIGARGPATVRTFANSGVVIASTTDLGHFLTLSVRQCLRFVARSPTQRQNSQRTVVARTFFAHREKIFFGA